MLAASGSMFFASTALAAVAPGGGNNGTVQINGEDFKNGNDPHISCPVTFKWAGFDPAPQVDTYTITFTGQNPTGGTIVTSEGNNQLHGTFTGPDFTLPNVGLTITGGSPNNKGEYHVTILVETVMAANTDTKSKTVWLGNCNPNPPSGGAISFHGSCTTAGDVNSGYTWAITATAVAGAPAANFPATWSDGGANSGGLTIVDGSSFTTPKGVNLVTVTPNAALPAGWTLTQPSAATPNPCGSAPTPASATAGANCNALSAHLVAASNADTTFDIVHNGVTDHVTVTKGQTQDVSYGSAAGANITVSVGGVQKATATASNSCGVNPGNPTPASASANADCSGLSAHLDGGTNGATFTVTEPGGTHQVVVGPGATQDVSYASGNGATISVNVGNTLLDTASSPTNCTGTAAPTVDEANHCKSGMNLTLSNMNGTADTTFTVTDPDGNTQQVSVNAGQLKKLAFAVTEDTTGTVTVSAPGLAKQTFTYKKNCATVLGVKHTRKPTHHTTKPVVKGEHSQLPFTGFDTRRALLDGAALFFFGAVLCILGARRKDEEIAY